MSADTDLDALIREHRVAAIEISDPATRRIVGTTRLNAAEAALRARLAPPPHADDEALIQNAIDLAADPVNAELNSTDALNAAVEALRARLAGLRARIAELEEDQKHMWPASDDGSSVFIDGVGSVNLDYDDKRLKRAENAEAALAACRAATITECDNLLDAFCEHHHADRSDEWHCGVEAAAREIRALKDKEKK